MREIHATVTLENIEDPSRQTTVEGFVDTDAVNLVIPLGGRYRAEAPPAGDENRRLRRRLAGATARRQRQDRNRRRRHLHRRHRRTRREPGPDRTRRAVDQFKAPSPRCERG